MLEKTSTVKQNKLLRNKMNGGKMKQAIHKLSSNTMGFSQKRKTKKGIVESMTQNIKERLFMYVAEIR